MQMEHIQWKLTQSGWNDWNTEVEVCTVDGSQGRCEPLFFFFFFFSFFQEEKKEKKVLEIIFFQDSRKSAQHSVGCCEDGVTLNHSTQALTAMLFTIALLPISARNVTYTVHSSALSCGPQQQLLHTQELTVIPAYFFLQKPLTVIPAFFFLENPPAVISAYFFLENPRLIFLHIYLFLKNPRL
jgi:hypothetical protein